MPTPSRDRKCQMECHAATSREVTAGLVIVAGSTTTQPSEFLLRRAVKFAGFSSEARASSATAASRCILARHHTLTGQELPWSRLVGLHRLPSLWAKGGRHRRRALVGLGRRRVALGDLHTTVQRGRSLSAKQCAGFLKKAHARMAMNVAICTRGCMRRVRMQKVGIRNLKREGVTMTFVTFISVASASMVRVAGRATQRAWRGPLEHTLSTGGLSCHPLLMPRPTTRRLRPPRPTTANRPRTHPPLHPPTKPTWINWPAQQEEGHPNPPQ